MVNHVSPKGRYWILKYKNTLEFLRAGTKIFHSVDTYLISVLGDDEETDISVLISQSFSGQILWNLWA